MVFARLDIQIIDPTGKAPTTTTTTAPPSTTLGPRNPTCELRFFVRRHYQIHLMYSAAVSIDHRLLGSSREAIDIILVDISSQVQRTFHLIAQMD